MYPKMIWQGEASVRGQDCKFRVVQTAEDYYEVEVLWFSAIARDAMGNDVWTRYDERWYNALVAQLIVKALATVTVTVPHFQRRRPNKVELIRLVRVASAYQDENQCMGLPEALRLVEKFLSEIEAS